MAMSRRKPPTGMKWRKPKTTEAEQVRCMLGDEGHVWISWMDHLTSAVRERLRNASFNICPACLIVEVGRSQPDADYFRCIEAWEDEDQSRISLPRKRRDELNDGEIRKRRTTKWKPKT
ncbi:MAG TPA: hypothetical protein VF913_18785 [Xanthobacteraceae bacterium]